MGNRSRVGKTEAGGGAVGNRTEAGRGGPGRRRQRERRESQSEMQELKVEARVTADGRDGVGRGPGAGRCLKI